MFCPILITVVHHGHTGIDKVSSFNEEITQCYRMYKLVLHIDMYIAVPNNEYNKKVSVMSLDLYLYIISPHNGMDDKF